jgi:hypothetical protein
MGMGIKEVHEDMGRTSILVLMHVPHVNVPGLAGDGREGFVVGGRGRVVVGLFPRDSLPPTNNSSQPKSMYRTHVHNVDSM